MAEPSWKDRWEVAFGPTEAERTHWDVEARLYRDKPAPSGLEVLKSIWDTGAGMARGSLGATLGLPGDLQNLVRALGEVDTKNRGRMLEAILGQLTREDTLFPRTQDWLNEAKPYGLPDGLKGRAAEFGQNVGEWLLFPGTGAALKGASKLPNLANRALPWQPGPLPSAERAVSPLQAYAGGGKVAKLAGAVDRFAGEGSKAARINLARRAPEGLVDFGGAAAPDSFAVRARGGNFNTPWLLSDLENHHEWVPNNDPVEAVGPKAINTWINTQLKNYIAKDLGAPTDPLLALEKELPNLHLNPATIDDAVGDLNSLRFEAAWGKQGRPSRDDKYRKAFEKLQVHNQLTGGKPEDMFVDNEGFVNTPVPLTPWGMLSDQALKSFSPTDYRDVLFNTKYGRNGVNGYLSDLSLAASRATNDTIDPNLINSAAEHFARDPMGMSNPLREAYPDVFKAFDETRAKVIPPWLDKATDDTKIWDLKDGLPLAGLDHVTDFMKEAVEANLWRESMRLDPNWLPQGATERRQVDMVRAGLDIDPEKLGRMSVPDVVRKVAEYNKWLEERHNAPSEGLSKGIKRVHKEYPEEGLRWVELGAPENLEPITELPEGYSVGPTTFDPSLVAVSNKNGSIMSQGRSADEAIQKYLKDANAKRSLDELEEGLNAEGEAMGHCVGGYCDEVAERGTKIYSLRDAKGNPHVTVEVRPGKRSPPGTTAEYPEGYTEEASTALAELFNKYEDTFVQMGGEYPKFFDMATDPGGHEFPHASFRNLARSLTGVDAGGKVIYGGSVSTSALRRDILKDLDDWAAKYPGEPGPEEIMQIKGKQNAAPVDKYKPAVQDFVKSGKWGKVHDLENTGLSLVRGGTHDLSGYGGERYFKLPEGYYSTEEVDKLLADQIKDPTDRQDVVRMLTGRRQRDYAAGGSVDASDEPRPRFLARFQAVPDGFAAGGKVAKAASAIERFANSGKKAARIASTKKFESPLDFGGASAPDSFAVRAKGGNFDDFGLGYYLGNEQLGIPYTKYDPPWGTAASRNHDFGDMDGMPRRADATKAWGETQLANYLRKELGSPADPLLKLEQELPGLHLPPETMLDAEGIASKYRIREAVRRRQLPSRQTHAGTNTNAQQVTDYLDKHDELTGGAAPLTPWGYHADMSLDSAHPNDYVVRQLDIGLLDFEGDFGPAETVTEAIEAFKNNHANLGKEVPKNLQKLAWAEDPNLPPDAEVFGLMDLESDPLGFSHVLDYLDAAQKPYNELKQWVDPEHLQTTLDRLVGNPWMHENQPMLPISQQMHTDWRDMNAAGLLLDPASLGRLSVADAVKKTAQWNEFLSTRGGGDLTRGIKAIHKEYPEEGLKWVELGLGDADELGSALPPGYRLQSASGYKDGNYTDLDVPEKAAMWRVVDDKGNPASSTMGWGGHKRSENSVMPVGSEGPQSVIYNFNKLLKQEELEAGLNAEGKAMGHCVGGYCDEVASRGTKIYSLRDAKGNPHVTVEVRPPSGWNDYRSLKEDPNLQRLSELPDEEVQKIVASQLAAGLPGSAETNVAKLKQLDYYYHPGLSRWISPSSLEDPIPDIIQIKGKQNAAPVEKYLPAVQDFVKSGKWGRVGDLGNTGLINFSGGKTKYRPGEDQSGYLLKREAMELEMPKGYMTPAEAADHLIKQGAPEDWARQHVGDFADNKRRGYAKGGSVVRSRFEAALAAAKGH